MRQKVLCGVLIAVVAFAAGYAASRVGKKAGPAGSPSFGADAHSSISGVSEATATPERVWVLRQGDKFDLMIMREPAPQPEGTVKVNAVFLRWESGVRVFTDCYPE